MPISPSTSESDLLAAMRAGDERAYTEFVQRWQPLLADSARRLGLSADDADDLVTDVLVDAASGFGAGREAPRTIGAYLVTALRNRARNHWRDEARRRARETDALDGQVDSVAGTVYADGRAAASNGRGSVIRERVVSAEPNEPPRAAPPLRRMADALARGLSAEERLLLVWAGHHVPHRTIAAWLGSNPGAVAKRVERLRARLRRAAAEHLKDVPEAERDAILRVLRRADMAGVDAARPDANATPRRARGRRAASSPTGEE